MTDIGMDTKKKTVIFSIKQINALEKVCEDKAISFSEIIKRLVDKFIDEQQETSQECPK